ncbi:MAG: flavodoxin [Coriobacteriia bacterium]|nr:flavodoxin [Coriobacteriia bacterium]
MANLIVYYSRKGQNYWGGAVKDLPRGNTEVVAEFVQAAVGGELFEIETVKDYPADYYQCTDEAKAERDANARPAVKAVPETAGYDTIFVGFPNWWGTLPMCLFTALEAMDLTGKRVCPFCTNEGSGMGTSEQDLARLCEAAGATLLPGLPITGNRAAKCECEVAAWAQKLV